MEVGQNSVFSSFIKVQNDCDGNINARAAYVLVAAVLASEFPSSQIDKAAGNSVFQQALCIKPKIIGSDG